jgi:uncharacterized membrane protein YphA (DoxX/SURF4 family)
MIPSEHQCPTWATQWYTLTSVVVVFELVAGVMIVFGWQLRWVALLMAALLLVDAFLAHPFWRYTGAEQHGQLLHYLKNFSMIGGLLLSSWVESAPSPGAHRKAELG